MQTLNNEDVKFYHENGYYLYHNQLFTPDEKARLTSIFEDHLNDKGSKLSDELDTPHMRDERLFEFLLHPNVLDLVEPLIGKDIGLFSSHFISKEPFTGRRTPWHEDSAYWEGKFDRMDQLVTVWFAIDDSDRENGCMGVIPGTHHDGFSEYEDVDATTNTFASEIKQGSIDESKAVWFEIKAGTCSLHDGRIIHGAGPNNSPRRRCGYTMRYFNLGMKFNPEAAPGHKLYHARGENTGNNPLTNV